MGKHAEKLTKVKPFVHKYKWGGIYVPSEKDDWKKIESNITIALIVFCAKKEKLYVAYVSKHNSNCEKQVIISMIPNGEKRKTKFEGRWWNYLPVKNYQHYYEE